MADAGAVLNAIFPETVVAVADEDISDSKAGTTSTSITPESSSTVEVGIDSPMSLAAVDTATGDCPSIALPLEAAATVAGNNEDSINPLEVTAEIVEATALSVEAASAKINAEAARTDETSILLSLLLSLLLLSLLTACCC